MKTGLDKRELLVFEECQPYSTPLLIRLYCHWMRQEHRLTKKLTLLKGMEGDHSDLLSGNHEDHDKQYLSNNGLGNRMKDKFDDITSILPQKFRFRSFVANVMNGKINCDTDINAFRKIIGKVTDEKKKKAEDKQAKKLAEKKKKQQERLLAKSLLEEHGPSSDDDDDSRSSDDDNNSDDVAADGDDTVADGRVRKRKGLSQFKKSISEFLISAQEDALRSSVFISLIHQGALKKVLLDSDVIAKIYYAAEVAPELQRFVPEKGKDPENGDKPASVTPRKRNRVYLEEATPQSKQPHSESPKHGQTLATSIQMHDFVTGQSDEMRAEILKRPRSTKKKRTNTATE